jgi:hypothetical protein
MIMKNSIFLLSIIFISLIIIISGQFTLAQYEELTPVPDELIDKLIIYYGEKWNKYKSDDWNWGEYKEYRKYPIYDIDGTIISYHVMYYYGDGELPTDEYLFDLAVEIYGKGIKQKEREEILKQHGLLNTQITTGINCYYELSPNPVTSIGNLSSVFSIYSRSKKFLSNYYSLKLEYSDFKGIVGLYGKTYTKWFINGNDVYLSAFSTTRPLTSKEELLEDAKLDGYIPSEEIINENIEKWRILEDKIKTEYLRG